MLLPKKPVQGIWGTIEKMLEKYGALNKKYDSNLDGVVDNADKVDGHDAGTSAGNVLVLDTAGQVPLANLPLIPASQLDFSFAWEKVAEVEASTAVQEIDITGLAGDTDIFYMYILLPVPVSSTTGYKYTVIFNGDTAIGNYAFTNIGLTSTYTVGQSHQTFGATSGMPGVPTTGISPGNIGGMALGYIHAKGITVGTETYVTVINEQSSLMTGDKISQGAWKKSAEVTEISLYCSAGAYIGEGTKLILFKPKW